MYKGKHLKKLHRRMMKSTALLVSLFLILSLGGTIAFLIDSTDPLQNLFGPSRITTEVMEIRDGAIKKDVYIKNTGDTEAWIRAAIVVTWQDEDGNIYGKAPVIDRDYEIKLNVHNKEGWLLGDDKFYYWYLPVKSVMEDAENCNTGVLIEECTYLSNAPDGYFLNVEIIGSGIQSKPANVFDTEWESSGLKVKTTDQEGSELPPEDWTLINGEVQE